MLQEIGTGATFPLLNSASLAVLAADGNYAAASAVVGTIQRGRRRYRRYATGAYDRHTGPRLD
ncbi:hypothetical protein [Mycobacterium uberis]|uniref:hypothetical protein n=1 Tax=Mycobacterium uberis TaxID=2162698 RepID=UPI0010583E13|nr:hypothetical protein [Mycobacterium uberis]